MSIYQGLKSLALFGALALTLVSCSSSSDNSEYGSGKATREQLEELETRVGDRVFFELDSSALTQDAQEILRHQAAFMSKNAELTFVIEGHADERGTREYNIALGERRANAVKNFLETLGVDKKRVTIVSYGKERPAVTGSNEWSWQQNRRAVTVAE